MARVKLGLRRPSPELPLMKKNDPLHSSSDQNLRETINVAEKSDQAMVATVLHTDQTMVPSYSSSCSDGDKQTHDHDQFHHKFTGRQSPVNESKKPVHIMRHACNPDHRHAISDATHDYNRIGCDQPLIKQEPVIIHARDPRIIHTNPGNFMLLVQSLTGSCTTRALCKQLQEKMKRKSKGNFSTCTATDEVLHETVDDLTVNDGLQQQKVKIKQQQHQKKKQKKNKNMSMERPKNVSMKRPAHGRQCCSHLAADHPMQSPHLSAHLSRESSSSSMDSEHKFTESPSLETDDLSSSPLHRLQNEGSMGSSPNISVNDDDTGVPFSKSWNMLTDSINSSAVMFPSFLGDKHGIAWTTVPSKFESIIGSFTDHSLPVKNIARWPLLHEDDVAVNHDDDLCVSHGFQLASSRNEGLNTEEYINEDHYAEYINESSFSIPPIIDFNVSSLCRSVPEILDIDSLFACTAEQIVQLPLQF